MRSVLCMVCFVIYKLGRIQRDAWRVIAVLNVHSLYIHNHRPGGQGPVNVWIFQEVAVPPCHMTWHLSRWRLVPCPRIIAISGSIQRRVIDRLYLGDYELHCLTDSTNDKGQFLIETYNSVTSIWHTASGQHTVLPLLCWRAKSSTNFSETIAITLIFV